MFPSFKSYRIQLHFSSSSSAAAAEFLFLNRLWLPRCVAGWRGCGVSSQRLSSVSSHLCIRTPTQLTSSWPSFINRLRRVLHKCLPASRQARSKQVFPAFSSLPAGSGYLCFCQTVTLPLLPTKAVPPPPKRLHAAIKH